MYIAYRCGSVGEENGFSFSAIANRHFPPPQICDFAFATCQFGHFHICVFGRPWPPSRAGAPLGGGERSGPTPRVKQQGV